MIYHFINIKYSEVFMYADDVAVVVVESSVSSLEQSLNIIATCLHEWFSINGLIINTEKTQTKFNLAGRNEKPLNVNIR